MYLKFIIPVVISFICFQNCFADYYIQPTKYEDQEEILVQGASIILSKKENSSILMYQTSKTITDRIGNFYFALKNNGYEKINFYFQNLKISDQMGRHVRIIPKQEHLENKVSVKNSRLFASALCTTLASMNAQNAGKINYQSNTNTFYRSNINAYGSNGYLNGSSTGYINSSTNGTIHSEALRQQAFRQVTTDSIYRNQAIEANYETDIDNLHNFYFDSSTILPDTIYSANFQIEVPKEIEKELEYLLFTFEVENVTHTFCFYCGEKVKKWYHFGG